MSLQTDLVVIPVTVMNNDLRVLLTPNPQGNYSLPNVTLGGGLLQQGAYTALAKNLFGESQAALISQWMASERFRTRVVEVFDKPSGAAAVDAVRIVRVLGIPEDLAKHTRAEWRSLSQAIEVVDEDSAKFLQATRDMIPFWARMTTLVFEILPAVFSIQDLRLIVSYLSSQDVDAGNFHRRLKRLDILRPLVAGQRVHKWEFVWEKAAVVAREGLLP